MLVAVNRAERGARPVVLNRVPAPLGRRSFRIRKVKRSSDPDSSVLHNIVVS